MNHTGPRTFAKRNLILQTTLWQRTRYPQQTTASWKKTGAETEGSSGANNHHVTWFLLALDFKISWIPISGTTRIPLTRSGGPSLKNNYPALGCSNLLTDASPMFTFAFEKAARWNQLKYRAVRTIKNIYTRHTYCWLLMDQTLHRCLWYNWLTSAFSNHQNVGFSKVQGIEEMMSFPCIISPLNHVARRRWIMQQSLYNLIKIIYRII